MSADKIRHGSDADRVPLSPENIRQQGNYLKNESSAYLKQHAHNPMDWHPWGEPALKKARREDKPIFLSIGYASCHWCHVMEKEVFERDDIAAFMNANYFNIKVDREERPDLDAVYMEAIQAMTGGGGWPLSVFLAPNLIPFYGGTYFPPDQFMLMATKLNEIYSDERARINDYGENLKNALARVPPLTAEQDITFENIAGTAHQAETFYDSEWGGLSEQMKFPTPVRWLFLLHYYRQTGEEKIAGMVKTTLDNMGSGGIHDHIGGGFHRYTVEKTWLIPHFEKMLYDNAQLASLYLEGAAVFKNNRYAEIARTTLDFMISDLSGAEGGFYASYDADSEAEEGTFYLWNYDEIVSLAGDKDGPALAMLLGFTPEGNFEGKNIVTRRASQAGMESHFKISRADTDRLFAKYHLKLREHRSKRIKPALDKKIITSWNGLAIAALAQGYAFFKDNRYKIAAEKAAEYIRENHYRDDGGLYRSSYDGKAYNEGILDDYVFLARGLLKLFQVTGEVMYFERAISLIDYVERNFIHENAGYYLTHKDQATPLARKVEIFDSVRPSGNSAMLQALLEIGALTGDVAYQDRLRRNLNAYSEIMGKAGLEMAGWHDAALKSTAPFYEVVVAGDKNSTDTQKLIETFHNLLPANAVLLVVPPADSASDTSGILPIARGKIAVDGKATAYVCRYGSCRLPANDPVQLKKQLLEGWKF